MLQQSLSLPVASCQTARCLSSTWLCAFEAAPSIRVRSLMPAMIDGDVRGQVVLQVVPVCESPVHPPYACNTYPMKIPGCIFVPTDPHGIRRHCRIRETVACLWRFYPLPDNCGSNTRRSLTPVCLDIVIILRVPHSAPCDLPSATSPTLSDLSDHRCASQVIQHVSKCGSTAKCGNTFCSLFGLHPFGPFHHLGNTGESASSTSV